MLYVRFDCPRVVLRRLCLLGLLCLTAAAGSAQAATLHVTESGDDAAAGTEAAPLRTIQKAVAQARAGDTVVVHGGLYTGHVIFRHSGAPDRPIVLKNAPGERPVFDGEGQGRIELKSERGWQQPIGWIVVEGLEIRNGWDGIKFYNAHHVVLRNNHIHDNHNQGILGNGHHVRMEGNVIARNGFKSDNEGSNLEHGIYCSGTDFTIVNNVIHSNKAYGIQIAGYPYNPENHPGPEFADARRWLISNNTLALNQNRGGIVIWQRRAADCVIQNNIFYRNSASLRAGAVQGIDFVGAGGDTRSATTCSSPPTAGRSANLAPPPPRTTSNSRIRSLSTWSDSTSASSRTRPPSMPGSRRRLR